MGPLVVLGIAAALAMDAFAVAIAVSIKLGRPDARQVFRLSFHFGLFQALMPVLGWLAGTTVAHVIQAVDHWIAFGLLAVVGLRMIREGLGPPAPPSDCSDPTRGVSLIVLSTATSIDALAIGLSLALVGVSIWLPAVIIGVVAAGFTLVGLSIGGAVGARYGHRTAVVGGVVLLAIGLRILAEHLA